MGARGLGLFVGKISLPALVLALDFLFNRNISRAALFAIYSTQTNDFGMGRTRQADYSARSAASPASASTPGVDVQPWSTPSSWSTPPPSPQRSSPPPGR